MFERLDAATPWESLAAPIRGLSEHNAPGYGHPAECTVLMLAKWFNLSDPGQEDVFKDRVSFRRFVGFSFTDKTPDETIFVRFRARLRRAKIHDALFEAVVDHSVSGASGQGGHDGRRDDHRTEPRAYA